MISEGSSDTKDWSNDLFVPTQEYSFNLRITV